MEEVRRARPEDIPGILRLLEQVCMVHHRGRPDLFQGPATKYTAEELRQLLVDGDHAVFVYDGGEGQVWGHAFCVLQDREESHVLKRVRTLYIDDICVDEEVRRRGVGRGLYEHVLRCARELGCQRLTLNVWSCNPGAMRFYEKLGFLPYKIGMEKLVTAPSRLLPGMACNPGEDDV